MLTPSSVNPFRVLNSCLSSFVFRHYKLQEIDAAIYVSDKGRLAVELLDKELRFRSGKQFDLLSYCLNSEPAAFISDDHLNIRSAFIIAIVAGVFIINT